MGEEASDDLRRTHDERLGAVVDTHNGVVVKGGGDGLLCTFDAASDAIASAVAMQQTIDQLAGDLGVELAIRVGVSVGDVTWERGDCFGMPVVEAARLESSAEAGQILVSEYVKVMARGRGGHEFDVRGELDLKGVPEPVMAYVVRWAPARRAMSRYEATPYVGRADELGVLEDAWRNAVDGRGSTIFVSADAGMGKSRLIDEFQGRLENALVLHGTCHSGEVAPYAPLADAIGAWARDDARPQEALGDQAPVIATMVPILHDVLGDIDEPPPVDPDVERRRLHEALVQLVDRLSQRSPLLMIVDDLHWIDLGSLAAVRAIAREAGSRRLLVLAAFRATDLADSDDRMAVMGEIEREALPRRIDLHGLTEVDVDTLLRRMGEVDAVPEDFVALFRDRSEGNPLFIRETLLNIVAEGKISQDESGEWTAAEGDIEVPSVLRNVIDRRLALLDGQTRSLLAIGALFDDSFPLDTTADVAGLAEDDSLDAVDEALEAQIVEPTDLFDQYRFTHAMYRHVLADGHNPSRRPRLHRRIAEALEKRLPVTPSPTDIARLTNHFLASADMPGAERGVPYALDQAHALERLASFEEARDAYEAALTLLPAGDERTSATLLDVARMTAVAGADRHTVIEAATAARDALAETEGDRAAVDAIVGVARSVAGGDIETAWRLADLVRPLHDDNRDEAWVWLRGWELAAADWEDPAFLGLPRDTDDRRDLTATARSLQVVLPFESGFFVPDAEAAREVAEHADPLDQAKIYAFVTGDLDRALEAALLAQQRADQVGDLATLLIACGLEGRLHLARCDLEGVGRCTDRGADQAAKMRDLSNPVLQYFALPALYEWERRPTEPTAGDDYTSSFFGMRNPDTNWLSALLQMQDIMTAARRPGQRPHRGEGGPGRAANGAGPRRRTHRHDAR